MQPEAVRSFLTSLQDQIVAALTAFAQQSEAGTLLPSERVLAEVLNVARMTVPSLSSAG